MANSRLSRYSEKVVKRRLFLAIFGTIAILLFLGAFGLRILIGFSLLVDKIRGSSPATNVNQVIILPPVLNPLPIATNSAGLKLTGTATANDTLIVYLNDAEMKKITVAKDGNFEITGFDLKEGENTISAKVMDDKGNLSELSNIVTASFSKTPPPLDITGPSDNSTIYGDNSTITVSGKTKEDTTVTVNDRFVVVQNDGSFSLNYRLNEGDNTLKIVATDQAGNQTTVERRVKYQK